MRIRLAEPADLPGVLAIHTDAVANGVAIWTEVTPDLAEREAWLARHQEPGRVALVAVADGPDDALPEGDVLAYGSYGPYAAKDGYRHTVENSVYVHPDAQGRGLGKALMVELLERATADGHHVMLALIEAENTASIALHTKLGFEQVGLLPEVGTKFGRWLDLAILRRTLA
ncbi:GNAT family N-acetyltransferase [Plantibacter sp. MMLR14_011]|uniref:GNAT family N-acetyltransferase n=1 Tax=Plantibacter sp. MMLR14_011 TaxID=1898746 RepID=UPI0008DD3637|nr:GNAT family N-acetyltransferase [Plantibacter sp. MMLR14_011]OII40106.1 GNAT family N-acetyltransferase [Plantibacter sp. MMLR14_011]